MTAAAAPSPDLPARAPWPYPRWSAHRGAGKLAPENTLAAFALGAQWGFRMFECDVKLSQDGVPFLLHDASLERTTDGQGLASDLRWAELARLDAGRWHSPAYAGEALASLERVAGFCLGQGLALNIEIKPTPGAEARTGAVVADAAARLWAPMPGALAPLLTSFSVDALAAAQSAQPGLPRGLLLDRRDPDWLARARRLACVAVVAEQAWWDAGRVQQARASGLYTLSYTVNEAASAQRLLALGLDALITDRVQGFAPATTPSGFPAPQQQPL